VEGQPTVSARLTVATYTLRDSDPTLAATDERILGHLRGVGELLRRPVFVPVLATNS
jgi:hypothetical protein